MKAIIYILFLPFALFLTGCVTTTYTPYQGAQQQLPIKPNSFLTQVDGINFYAGGADRPYKIVGCLSAYGRPLRLNAPVAASARQHGAQAVVLKELTSDAIYVGPSQPAPSAVQIGTSQTHVTAEYWLINFTGSL